MKANLPSSVEYPSKKVFCRIFDTGGIKGKRQRLTLAAK